MKKQTRTEKCFDDILFNLSIKLTNTKIPEEIFIIREEGLKIRKMAVETKCKETQNKAYMLVRQADNRLLKGLSQKETFRI